MKCCNILILFANILVVYGYKNDTRLEAEGIAGGDAAEIGQFKYMVSIQANGHHYCGGSIIGEQHVLTAAHCIINSQNDFNMDFKWTIVAGVINAITKKRTVLRLKVKKAYVPTEFSVLDDNLLTTNFRQVGDIAVLKLDKPFGSRNRVVRILNLPTGNLSYENEHPIVIGYGYEKVIFIKNPYNDNDIEIPVKGDYKLKYAVTTVLPNNECKQKMQCIICPSHLCAQVKQYDSDFPEGVCLGDSGGPLVLNDDTVIGVVSNGPVKCSERVIPTIYTRVTSYISFLDKATNDIDSSDIRTRTY